MENLLTTVQAAEMLGLKPQTLRLWRYHGKGPHYFRYGGPNSPAYYSPGDIHEWLQKRRYGSTSEESAKRP